MSSARTARFAKTSGCPAAETLECYTHSEFSASTSKPLASHLAECDFCCAEAYFLAKHQTRSPYLEAPQMPEHLRLLAEALLKRRVYGGGDLFEFGLSKG